MTQAGLATFLALALASPLAAERDSKVKKPHLDLRANPRVAFSPVTVHLTAELLGGGDAEEYYCPQVEWEWDDGGKSIQEGDCHPYSPGTKIERRFTAEHDYPKAGVYQIKVTLRRANQTLASTTARVTVRPGLGDETPESSN
jgi:hypothetical protein